ncbi:hypothetical protein MNBD_GAMMA05-2490 [hydrothermal vent metagenome]|uniref:Histidine kinase n=1 Tax=hydrothermal vent metagenome TaxID=652676 RepID=A0A3B0WW68_9ZZZZ
MQVFTYRYSKKSQWDKEPDASLDSDSTLLLFFGSAHSEDVESTLHSLSKNFPLSLKMGCSTAGEIYEDAIYEHGISLAIIKFDKTKIKVASELLSNNGEDGVHCGERVANALNADGLRSIFVLSDGIDVNGSELVAAISSQIDDSVILTGGLGGDDDRFEKTWTWKDGEMLSGCITAVGFYGESINIEHGSRGGWDVLGTNREVTKSKDNVLYELDGQPALALYKKYLGDRADGLPGTGLLFPLAIKNDEEIDGYTVRTILGINEEEDSITFAGNIPEGVFVRLMSANFDRLIDGAADAAGDININEYSRGSIMNIAISCVGRRLILGQRAEEEIEVVANELPEQVKQIGFYSYGEISPLSSGRCDLHNQTMTLTTFWED